MHADQALKQRTAACKGNAMQITDEMLRVGLKKLMEAGLILRHPLPEEAARIEQVLHDMLKAVLAAGRSAGLPDAAAQRTDGQER